MDAGDHIGATPPELLKPVELAALLRVKPGAVYKRLGLWGEEHGVVRYGSRYTRIQRSVFMPLWAEQKIPGQIPKRERDGENMVANRAVPAVIPQGEGDSLVSLPSPPTESAIEEKMCRLLHERGIYYRRQVPCAFGKADIVTDDCIIEIKVWLDTKSIQRAVGQSVLYRLSIGAGRRSLIVSEYNDLTETQMTLIRALDLTILSFKKWVESLGC